MKKVLVVLGILVVLAGAALLIVNITSEDEPASSDSDSSMSSQTELVEQENTEPEQSTAGTFTIEEVTQHDSASDCWTIIGGDVYDITSYVSEHPGGDEIERACGIDGTTLFERRETESGETVGSGTPHSSTAESQLRNLQIGTLAN